MLVLLDRPQLTVFQAHTWQNRGWERGVVQESESILIQPAVEMSANMYSSVNFCAHTLLSSPEKGLVALDLTKDWRFSNNTYTVGQFLLVIHKLLIYI